MVMLTLPSAKQLLSWLPKLRILSVVDRRGPLKKSASGLRHLWLDNSFDAAVELVRGRGIEVQ